MIVITKLSGYVWYVFTVYIIAAIWACAWLLATCIGSTGSLTGSCHRTIRLVQMTGGASKCFLSRISHHRSASRFSRSCSTSWRGGYAGILRHRARLRHFLRLSVPAEAGFLFSYRELSVDRSIHCAYLRRPAVPSQFAFSMMRIAILPFRWPIRGSVLRPRIFPKRWRLFSKLRARTASSTKAPASVCR